jgi:DDE family transposase
MRVPLEKLFALLPVDLLDRLALQYRVNAVNQIRLSGQLVFLCLLNGVVNHAKLTQRLLEETYAQLTGQTADHSSFGKRLATLPPEYVAAVFHHLLQQLQPRLPTADQRAVRLRIVDATTVVLSAKLLAFGLHFGSGGRAGKDRAKRHVKGVFALTEELPEFLHLCRTQSEADDNVALGDPMIGATQPGDLWLVDRGLVDRDRLLALHQAGSFFLLPHKDQKWRTRQTVWTAPPDAERPPPTVKEPAPCRLLRVEAAVFENSNDAVVPARQRKWAQMPLVVLIAERYDQRTKGWKPFVLLTNLTLAVETGQAGPFPFAELLELYRRRWEIETFFKFLKQHLSYAHLLSRNENGIRVMIWMALIAAVLLLWYKAQTGIDRGWRSVKFWLAEDVRAWTAARLRDELEGAGLAPG